MTDNNSPIVFISHAGADSHSAHLVAEKLDAGGIKSRLDRREVGSGGRFVAFMESALSVSDYCLLLWSRKASTSDWVAEEWQSAFCRAVAERRAFLTVGRLEELPIPTLLRGRLWVDLFPDLEPGLSTLVREWRGDRKAAKFSGAPVADGPNRLSADIDDADNVPMYLSSNLYDFTFPIRASLEQPVGVLLDRIIAGLELPERVTDKRNRLGLDVRHGLMIGDDEVDRAVLLGDTGAVAGSVLRLLVEVKMVAPTAPVVGSTEGSLKFLRSGSGASVDWTSQLSDEVRGLLRRTSALASR